MKISQKALACNLSPMRKFHPFAVAATNNGKKIYHLNIGQPDIATPPAYFEAVRNFELPVLEYAPSPGLPVLIKAVQDYYDKLGIHYEESDILITTGGSEALQMLMLSILDDGSEVIIPEPFYPNYNTFIKSAGGTIRPLTTSPEGGYRYAFREKLEALINENAVIIDSVSKRFSACGARIGTIITRNKELQQNLMKFCQARLSVATLDQIASAALYSVDSDYFDAVRKEYKLRRDTCYNKLLEIPGVVVKEPQGAFYMMAALPVDNADTFQKWLLTDFDDNGDTVMFAPGEGFYATPGKGLNEIRIAYVLKQKDLERAMDLLALGIKKYNETHCK